MIQDLVGLPWKDNEMDCVRLAVLAREELTGERVNLQVNLNYSPGNLKERTKEILKELNRIAVKVQTPEAGDLGVFSFAGFVHLGTFISPAEILHITRNRESKITRYSQMENRIKGIYRLKEVREWK